MDIRLKIYLSHPFLLDVLQILKILLIQWMCFVCKRIVSVSMLSRSLSRDPSIDENVVKIQALMRSFEDLAVTRLSIVFSLCFYPLFLHEPILLNLIHRDALNFA